MRSDLPRALIQTDLAHEVEILTGLATEPVGDLIETVSDLGVGRIVVDESDRRVQRGSRVLLAQPEALQAVDGCVERARRYLLLARSRSARHRHDDAVERRGLGAIPWFWRSPGEVDGCQARAWIRLCARKRHQRGAPKSAASWSRAPSCGRPFLPSTSPASDTERKLRARRWGLCDEGLARDWHWRSARRSRSACHPRGVWSGLDRPVWSPSVGQCIIGGGGRVLPIARSCPRVERGVQRQHDPVSGRSLVVGGGARCGCGPSW